VVVEHQLQVLNLPIQLIQALVALDQVHGQEIVQ
jgi:hypothetical protein